MYFVDAYASSHSLFLGLYSRSKNKIENKVSVTRCIGLSTSKTLHTITHITFNQQQYAFMMQKHREELILGLTGAKTNCQGYFTWLLTIRIDTNRYNPNSSLRLRSNRFDSVLKCLAESRPSDGGKCSLVAVIFRVNSA